MHLKEIFMDTPENLYSEKILGMLAGGVTEFQVWVMLIGAD
jgi:hypothetical protein